MRFTIPSLDELQAKVFETAKRFPLTVIVAFGLFVITFIAIEHEQDKADQLLYPIMEKWCRKRWSERN